MREPRSPNEPARASATHASTSQAAHKQIAPISLCFTRQPEHSAKTVPLAQACGFTRFTVVSPHRLHVNFTCGCMQRWPLLSSPRFPDTWQWLSLQQHADIRGAGSPSACAGGSCPAKLPPPAWQGMQQGLMQRASSTPQTLNNWQFADQPGYTASIPRTHAAARQTDCGQPCRCILMGRPARSCCCPAAEAPRPCPPPRRNL